MAANWLNKWSGPLPANQPPLIEITSPANNTEIDKGMPIEIRAYAQDPDGAVVKVEFFAGTTRIVTLNDGSAGWAAPWAATPEGTVTLTAEATDNNGVTTTSRRVTVIVKTAGGGGR